MTAAIYPTAKSPPARAVRPGVVTAVVCLALDAYSLVFASLLLPAGAIGDRFGRRWVLIAGLSIFGAASAVAMTANSAGELIGLRAVMGLGAALVMPATLSTITGPSPASSAPEPSVSGPRWLAGPPCWACWSPEQSCTSGHGRRCSR